MDKVIGKSLKFGLIALSLSWVWHSPPVLSDPSVFRPGHVFVSVGDGLVQHYDTEGNLLDTLDTGKGLGAFTTGCGFDSAGSLYVTTFNGGDVTRFTGPGVPHINEGAFGGGYSGNPESVVFDAVGNVYVGAVDGDNDIRQFDAEGNFKDQFDVEIERRGADWIDLAADQRTLFYTSEGTRIMRYDVLARTQLADFTSSLPGSVAFAFRILPDNRVLVSDSEFVLLLDRNGNEVDRYDVPGEDTWFSLNLDPDGKSFWAGNFGTGRFYKFDITTHNARMVDTGRGAGKLFGICLFEEVTSGTSDRDGDGLPDVWETIGFDVTGDGLLLNLRDLDDLCSGSRPLCEKVLGTGPDYTNVPPNPDHKDVYVWIDWLQGDDHPSHRPNEAALKRVIDAFHDAPIDNEEGGPGINLHIVLGRPITETEDLEVLGYFNILGRYVPSELEDLKKQYLQQDGQLDGMAGVFRYAVYGHYLPEQHGTCRDFGMGGRPGGIAPGFLSYFIVPEEEYREAEADELYRAAVFMHELGHTFNLRHGGLADEVNYKPNHLSVMNYSFAAGLLVRPMGEDKALRSKVDYSRFGSDVIPDLKEDGGLIEAGGLRGGNDIADFGTHIYKTQFGVGRPVDDVNSDIDWNFNKATDLDPVKANVNGDVVEQDGGTYPNKCTDNFTTLSTYNEWEGLDYKRGGIGVVAALIPELPSEVVVGEPDIPPNVILAIVSPVLVDIKPGSDPNSIGLKSGGVIPVAILTTDDFDATKVDPLSVQFGPNGSTEAHGRGHMEDVDADGDLDLVLHFKTQDTGITCGDISASLKGKTFGGKSIEGSDSIVTVGCR